ncbi:MAG: LysR family transcriptional regulator [Carboxydocellales bacterium]
MDINQLRAFYHVSKCSNFSRASEELFISQPALSRQIASLETAVGMQLFYRNGRGVILTDAGRRLLPYAENVIANISNAEKMFSEQLNLQSGELTLVSCTTVGNYVLPATIADYQQRFPGIKINVILKHTKDAIKKILEREVELGVVPGPISEKGIYTEPYKEDKLVLTVSPGHPLLNAESVDFSDQVILASESGSSSRELMEAFLEKQGITPKKLITLGNTEALKRGVIYGMGIALLPLPAIELELDAGILCCLPGEEFEVHRQLLCAYTKDYRLSPAALAFIALVRKSRH